MLDDNKQIISLDKNVYTQKKPVSKAIEISLRCLFSIDHAPVLERSTKKNSVKIGFHSYSFQMQC